MPNCTFDDRCRALLDELRETGQYKHLRHITGPMGPTVQVEGVGEVVMLCSNNYLGLADHPEVVEAGLEGLRRYGAGTASVRFICGTFDCHRMIEQSIAAHGQGSGADVCELLECQRSAAADGGGRAGCDSVGCTEPREHH